MSRSRMPLRRAFALIASLALVAGLTPLPAAADTDDLFFSEYAEGTSFNKALEIFNGTGSAVDLSAYSVELYSNGASAPSQSATLSGTLADGDVFVMAHASADGAILAVADMTSSTVVNFNGDDAVALRMGAELVDAIGQIGFDPGTEWGTGQASTVDNTIRRKASVQSGDTNGSDAFDPSVEWDGFPGNTWDGLGAHLVDEPAATLLINEVDADQAGTDAAEFIELYDGGAGNSDLTGLALVLFNGSNNLSYGSFDLDGQTTDEDGYFVLCGDATTVVGCDTDAAPNTNAIQNGADAVALYSADGTDFPANTAVTTTNLLDAVVYDTGQADDPELLPLLNSGQPQVDENTGGGGTTNSNQRCPNGSGGARNTDTYAQFAPTAGAANICVVPPAEPVEVFIHEVQGAGASSPLAGDDVIVEGIVVGDFQGAGQLGGFFLQEEDLQVDADALSSEGIFVFSDDLDVAAGDVVQVTGTVTEFFGLTEITGVTETVVTSVGAGGATATALAFPLDNAGREAVEGMLVTLSDLYVTDTFNLHRFGEVWLGAGGVIEQATNQLPAGPEMEAMAAENMMRSILMDDGSDDSNPSPIPYLHASGTLRVGDSVGEITAVMSFGFDSYRLQPVANVAFDETNPRPAVPDVGGDITVAGFNVLNYWTTIGCGFECRGAQTPEQLAVQTEKLVAAIMGMDADIVGLVEIENLPGGDPDDPNAATHTPIRTLVEALNAAEGSEVWAWVGPTNHYNAYPIRNEFIYRIGVVSPVGDPTALAHPAFDAVGPSGDPYGRPPLAQTFEAAGAEFTVVVNHFKSKGSTCGEPNENLDGQGNCNLKRIEQSEALLDFVADLQTADPDVLVLGDMNAYMEEDPIHTLETELTNLVTAYDADPYSYNFFATFSAPFIGRGSLDHAFATGTMADQVSGTATWHINADEPRFLDWFNPATSGPGPYRSSDHDPVLVGLSPEVMCGGRVPTIFGTSGDDVLRGTNGRDVIAGLGGNDVIDGRNGNDVICGGAGDDTIEGGNGNDTIDAGSGVDFVEGGNGNDTIDGGGGHDVVDGGSGRDTLIGSDGDDVVLAGSGDDTVEGGADDDVLFGGSGNDAIDGGEGFDRLFGDNGRDTCTTGEFENSCNESSRRGDNEDEDD